MPRHVKTQASTSFPLPGDGREHQAPNAKCVLANPLWSFIHILLFQIMPTRHSFVVRSTQSCLHKTNRYSQSFAPSHCDSSASLLPLPPLFFKHPTPVFQQAWSNRPPPSPHSRLCPRKAYVGGRTDVLDVTWKVALGALVGGREPTRGPEKGAGNPKKVNKES